MNFEWTIFWTDDITENILSLLAPQLENLCISGVLNVDPVKKPPDQEYLFLPILPRLKVLRILQRQFSLSESSTWFRPRLYLRFASGERLRYSEQFPVLGKLVVHVVPCHMGRGWDVPAENLHLEATMLLLQVGMCRNLQVGIAEMSNASDSRIC